MKAWKAVLLLILAVVLAVLIAFGAGSSGPGPENPRRGEAVVWYLGHCGYAVRTQDPLLIFDYQEQPRLAGRGSGHPEAHRRRHSRRLES